MKRILAFAVATLMFAVASSAQAADVSLSILSRVDGQQIAVPAVDAKVVVMNQDGEVVAESEGTANVEFDLEPGDYDVVVEQESTGLSGQQTIAVGENGFAGEFTLTSEGMRVVDLNAPIPSATINPVASPGVSSTSTLPRFASTGMNGANGMGMGAAGSRGIGGLAILGVIGGLIATVIAVDDDDTPVSAGSVR